MTINQLRIATRRSPLALWQAHFVREQLLAVHPGLSIDLVELTTSGDKDQSRALSNIGGKSLFVKELQQALLDKRADIAVHCIKDMSVTPHPQLTLGAILKRGNPGDAFVSTNYQSLTDLPQGATVGTASPRRQSLLLAERPDLSIKLLRGNVNSRLTKLDQNEFDAIILASAGLERLGFAARITAEFPINTFTPAIGQGALGVECCVDDIEVQELLACLHDEPTADCMAVERHVNQVLGGSCFSPIGAYAIQRDNTLKLSAFVGALDGTKILRATQTGSDAHAIGQHVADDLIQQGARALIK
ncbi:MAG: hydroxymethylbilane synthase [Coxiella sp. (in: Bacteria)]|nr:MAG: hydroxymethylbilane synthase [Coxiella sp. (in: g-proteobacteria)]